MASAKESSPKRRHHKVPDPKQRSNEVLQLPLTKLPRENCCFLRFNFLDANCRYKHLAPRSRPESESLLDDVGPAAHVWCLPCCCCRRFAVGVRMTKSAVLNIQTSESLESGNGWLSECSDNVRLTRVTNLNEDSFEIRSVASRNSDCKARMKASVARNQRSVDVELRETE